MLEFKDKAVDAKYSDLMNEIEETKSVLRDLEAQVEEIIASNDQE